MRLGVPMRAVALVTFVFVSALAAGCSDSPTSATVSAPFSQTDIIVGTGDEAVTGGSITVNYTGWLYDATKPDFKGLVFDSSLGKTPFSFTLGSNQVIQGWEQGVPGMKVGGTRRLIIPPSLGYGSTRSGPIAPNATLLFDIQLVSVTTTTTTS